MLRTVSNGIGLELNGQVEVWEPSEVGNDVVNPLLVLRLTTVSKVKFA
jgi:hypothetical protein